MISLRVGGMGVWPQESWGRIENASFELIDNLSKFIKENNFLLINNVTITIVKLNIMMLINEFWLKY